MERHDAEHDAEGIDARDHVPQPGGRLTGATIATVRDRLLKDGLLFRLDDEGIARHFASYFFEGNAWQVDLSVLRDVVSAVDGAPDDVPADPGEFATWVREDLLEFDHLPREKLAELYQWASEDLAAIERNVGYCKGRIAEMERARKSEEHNSNLGFYRYFLAMTEVDPGFRTRG
jgi:hypothetical protein